MSTPGAATRAAPPLDLASLLRAMAHWLAANTRPAIITAAISGAIAFVVNTALMLVVYDGYMKVGNGPATGSGNWISGSLIWGIGSTIVMTIVGYRRAVGREKFWQDIRGIPATIESLFRQDGRLARAHLLWGAAISLVTTLFVSPWLSLVLAAGLFAVVPSLLRQIVSNLLLSAWSSLARHINPAHGAALTGTMAMTVGMLGASAALTVGFFVADTALRLFVAIACGGIAWVLGRQQPPTPTAALMLLLGTTTVALLYDLFAPLVAFAHDGGAWENQGSVVKALTSPGGAALVGNALVGGSAAAAGGAAGNALGQVLGGASGGADAGGQQASSPSAPPPPPIADPFNNNKPLQGWKPGMLDSDGQPGNPGDVLWGGKWVDRDTARERIEAALDADRRRAAASVKFHDESVENNTRWLREKHDEAERAQEDARQRQRAAELAKEADDKRRKALEDGIKNTIRGMDPSDQRTALIKELGELMQNGDTKGAEELWRGMRGDRQSQLDAWNAQARADDRWAAIHRAGELAATGVREISKVVLVTAAGGVVAEAGFVAAAATGAGTIGSVNAAERGTKVGPDGQMSFDGAEGLKGFAEGAKTGVSAAIGGVKTAGSIATALTKVGSRAALDAAETYAHTGDVSKALTSGAISLAGNAAGEAVDVGIANDLKRRAVDHAVNILGNTAEGVNQGANVGDAFKDALKGEAVNAATGVAAKKFVNRATGGSGDAGPTSRDDSETAGARRDQPDTPTTEAAGGSGGRPPADKGAGPRAGATDTASDEAGSRKFSSGNATDEDINRKRTDYERSREARGRAERAAADAEENAKRVAKNLQKSREKEELINPDKRMPDPDSDSPEEKARFKAMQERMAAEAGAKRAQDDLAARRAQLDRLKSLEQDAKRLWVDQDPRRAMRDAQDQRIYLGKEIENKGTEVRDLRDRYRNGDTSVGPEIARKQQELDKLYAERVAAGERERDMAERLQDHMKKEARVKEVVDSQIRDRMGMAKTEENSRGSLRVVADDWAVREEARLQLETKKDWLKKEMESDPKLRAELENEKPIPVGVQGSHDSRTQSTTAVPDRHIITHEEGHRLTHPKWNDEFKVFREFDEGATEHTANKVSPAAPGKGAYPEATTVIRSLEEKIGPVAMEKAKFHGEVSSLYETVGLSFGKTGVEGENLGRERVQEIAQLVQDGRKLSDLGYQSQANQKFADAQNLVDKL